ncbi:helix-turn-helix domain-containing protein [Haliscomenobacter hydrossis]|uniref:Helix-turn-helix domain protein n=1 Tax=Haliscomenobacter hydrossis (strain ATCC 27775 / DSM 1100 / LMG 10767 / O) TaxID=760192 RepID=F4KYN0_HALH1|nr:helix-turn-helix transcriptional regulator [Haliscomenobacter hydrossis]AEE50436.1 helix-turn-helix domain protein [Haliscomenobacter hydrossis DSM 1100]
MNNETSGSETPHVKVRMLLRQVGLDQVELAKKLNLSEPVISSALNGKNEKSFQRIVDLLMREYNFTHEDIYQQSITLTQMVQEGLERIETRLDEMQEMIKRLDERLK